MIHRLQEQLSIANSATSSNVINLALNIKKINRKKEVDTSTEKQKTIVTSTFLNLKLYYTHYTKSLKPSFRKCIAKYFPLSTFGCDMYPFKDFSYTVSMCVLLDIQIARDIHSPSTSREQRKLKIINHILWIGYALPATSSSFTQFLDMDEDDSWYSVLAVVCWMNMNNLSLLFSIV